MARLPLVLLPFAVLAISLAVRGQTESSQTDPVLVGAGDIASCTGPTPATSAAEATAKLLETIPGTVFTAGDDAYPNGSAADFRDCYEPTWGRLKERTRPSPGNHEYAISNTAEGYFDYFGPAAGPERRGYYSFELGTWHIVSLNSNIPASADSAQGRWLTADLEEHRDACVLAYWHHPLFSSGLHGNNGAVRGLWDILYAHGADVVVNGHDHGYERFAPQTPDGKPEPHGIREFVVGTGGAELYPYIFLFTKANSEVRNSGTPGVIKFGLHEGSYSWEFLPVPGGTFHDSGSAKCV